MHYQLGLCIDMDLHDKDYNKAIKYWKKYSKKISKFGSPRLLGLPTKLHQVKHVTFFYHFQIENLAILANSNPRQSNTFIFNLYILYI
jgi:hypothetical protein